MAELTAGRRAIALPDTSRVLDWVLAHREVVAVGALMAIAALLRFWDLDAKALHHDESLHATYTWYLYSGKEYVHDPLMHGPFKFISGAAVFFLFGDNDYTTRILPALFGSVLVGMPYLLRRQIGMQAVLIAGVLLMVSPTLLYISRFYRDDIYISVWTLGIVICVWRYLEEKKAGYLYALAALLSLSFATMEITFIHAAILMVFLDIMLAIELGAARPKEKADATEVWLRTACLVPIAWLVAASWPLLGRKPFGRTELPPVGDVMMIIGTFTLPQFAAGMQHLPGFHDQGYDVRSEDTLRNVTVLFLLLVSVYAGLIWRPKVWLIAAVAFYAPYVLLYTTFFTNPNGFFSGIWGSLDYWLAQQDVQRGNQPSYYYALLTPLYEFLPLVLAIGGAFWLAVRGDSLRRWLLFWLAGIFAGLSLAGEKMPWLELHIALPLALVAALSLSRAIDALELRGERWLTAAYAAVLTIAATLLLVEGDGAVRIAGWLLAAGLGVWALSSGYRDGRKALQRGVLVIAVVALFTLTVRSSLTLSFKNPDTPVEMLVYTQTSGDIPRLTDQINLVAKQSGLGYNLPIVVDSTDGYAWPWAWYLRHYHTVSYVELGQQPFQADPNAVLLISTLNSGLIQGDYTQEQYVHRWWFREEAYRDLSAGDVIDKLTSLDSLKALGNFFLYRLPAEESTGSTDAVAFFPRSYGNIASTAQPQVNAAPARLPDGRIVFGSAGNKQGQFFQPADVFVDSAGNIWVADSRNHRIEKFDSAGNFVTSLGRSAKVAAQFNEPWSVAVDAQGFVYVADTWAHHIQKYAPDLSFIASWGVPSGTDKPGLLELFGPRDIAIAADGTLWVTDTGNKRLIHYSAIGAPIEAVGSEGAAPGQFSEPTGLVFANGRYYVADAWNGRIQVLDAAMKPLSAFSTGWASDEIIDKPYLAVLSDGRIVASDPANGALILFDASGKRLGTWKPDANVKPIGVAATSDGGFVFTDARQNQVQIVPAALVNSLFK